MVFDVYVQYSAASAFCRRKNVKDFSTHGLRIDYTSPHSGTTGGRASWTERWGGRNKAKEKKILSRGRDRDDKRVEEPYEEDGLNWDERPGGTEERRFPLCRTYHRHSTRGSLGSRICYPVWERPILLLSS